jgi:toxin-antitoxin system PIN domain toxin
MNTLNFLDSNVWLALIWSQHAHSEKARSWFEQAGNNGNNNDNDNDEQFFFCRFTQITVLRLLTTDQVMGKDTKSMSEAWGLWDRLWADDRIAFLPEPDGLEKEFRSRSRISSRSPKIWADSYLLAFAAVAGLKFVTFDQALQTRGADVLVL